MKAWTVLNLPNLPKIFQKKLLQAVLENLVGLAVHLVLDLVESKT